MDDVWIALIIVGIVVVALAAVMMVLLCVNSGDISRQEEKEELKNAECRMQNAE